MSRQSIQSLELAWDISDWDNDADLSEDNIRYNMERQFLANGFILPSSIVCNVDQERKLKEYFSVLSPNLDGLEAIDLGYGVMRLKVIQNGRYQRSVR